MSGRWRNQQQKDQHLAVVEVATLIATALRCGIREATAAQVAAERKRRAQAQLIWPACPRMCLPDEVAAFMLLDVIQYYGSRAKALSHFTAVIRRHHQDPELAEKEITDQYSPEQIAALRRGLAFCVDRLREQVLPLISAQVVAFPPRRETSDRDQIRRDKPESTTGPPLKRQRRPLLRTGAPKPAHERAKSYIAATSPAYVESFRSATLVAEQSFCAFDAVADLRFAHDIVALVRLGDRAVYEVFAQVGRERHCRQYLESLVHEFVSRLTPEMLAITGGDQLPPTLLHLVPGEDDP